MPREGAHPVVKHLVLDVLKPHEPQLHEFASRIASLSGVESVNVTLAEIDQSTESVKVSITGTDIDLEEVKKRLEEQGAVVHSIDEVGVAKKPSAHAK